MNYEVHFNGFWPGFMENVDPINSAIMLQIISKSMNHNCVAGVSLETSHILCESVFAPSVINSRVWMKTFLFSGESYLNAEANLYDLILWGAPSSGKIVNFPFFSGYLHLTGRYNILADNRLPKRTIPAPNNNILALITNQHAPFRNKLLDKLESAGIKITYAGKFRNNTGYNLCWNYFSDDQIKYLHNFKFVLAFENTRGDAYVTEKVAIPMLAQTIPIYYGSRTVTDYFNAERFINIQDDSDQSINNLISQIRYLSNTPEAWLDMVNKPALGPVRRTIDIIADDAKKALNVVDDFSNLCSHINKPIVPSQLIFSKPKNILDHIDAILYINLESRPDRREHFLTEIAKLCTDMSKVHRIDAIPIREFGALGCARSHVKAFELFETTPEWKTCLVFEDDFTFRSDNISGNNAYICQFFENPEFSGWDGLSLGHNPWRVVYKNTGDQNVKQVLATITASAYCVKRSFLPKIKANFQKAAELMVSDPVNKSQYACDMYWRKLFPFCKWYLLAPAIGYQYGNYSDIESREVSYNC